MNISDLWDRYYTNHVVNIRDSRRPVDAWNKYLGRFFGGRGINQVDTDSVSAYRDSRLRDGVSKATISREIGILIACIRWNYKRGYIDRAPYISRDKIKGFPRTIPEGAIKRLLAVTGHEYYPLVCLALLTGQRRAALLDLKWSNVRMDLGHIDFNTPDAPAFERMKGRAIIPLVGELASVIDWLYVQRKGDYVLHKDGEQMKWHWNKWRALCDEAQVQTTFHMLRHTVASKIIASGGRLEEASKLLGHRSVRTTEDYYWKSSPEFLKSTINKLSIKVVPDVAA